MTFSVHLPTAFIVSQNPQVEGVNQHRYIFDSKFSSSARPSYLAQYDSDSGLVLLNAGTAHGVTLGAEFAFYAAHDSHASGKPLHTFIVNNSASFFSTLRPANDNSCQTLPTSVFAVFHAKPGLRGTIRLYLRAERNSTLVLHEIRRLLHNVEFVNSPKDAHLQLSVRDNQMVVSVKDRKVTIYGFDHKFPIMKATPHDVASFLEKAGSFYGERDRRTNIDSEFAKLVTLEFYKLEATRSKFEDIPECQLGESGPNLHSADIIDFIVEEGCVYGIKLTNLNSCDLHPTVLYLENSDLSISNVYHFSELINPLGTYYEPSFSGSNIPEAPLKRNGGTLTIGYGSGGMPPFSYPVPDVCNIGFLKLLVSTRPIHSTAGTWPCLCRLEVDGPSTLDGGESWGTLTIPMIQRRFPAPTFSSNVVSSVPLPTFAHLVSFFFLVHCSTSTFQIYRPRHLSETELDAIVPHSILSMPFQLCFRFIYLFSERERPGARPILRPGTSPPHRWSVRDFARQPPVCSGSQCRTA